MMVKRRLTTMTPAKIRCLRPEEVDHRLNRDEITAMMQACEAFWLHSGNPADPHVVLHAGDHSDGFIKFNEVLVHGNLLLIMAKQIVMALRENFVGQIDYCVGSATSALDLAREVAGILGCKWLEMKKTADNKQEVVGEVSENAVILHLEELMTTGDSSLLVRAAIRAKCQTATFVPYLPVCIFRPGSDSLKKIEDSLIVPLAYYQIKNRKPDACDLCDAGSQVVKPKDLGVWEMLIGKKPSGQAPAIISRVISYTDRLNQRFELVNSRFCSGFDPDQAKLDPDECRDPNLVCARMLAILEEIEQFALVVKPNTGFWGAIGAYDQLRSFTRRAQQLGLLVIGDRKSNDIGATAIHYAMEMFDHFGFDAVTVNAYMGTDTLEPWLAWGPAKAIYVLAHTTNKGAPEFQERDLAGDDAKALFVEVAEKCRAKQTPDTAVVGLVMAATFPEHLAALGRIPDQTLMLIPGLGKQKGEAEATVNGSRRFNTVYNSSGAILHAAKGPFQALVSARKAREFRDQLNQLYGIAA